MNPASILYGFDVADQESWDFLSYLIVSGDVPEAEMNEILELSLMRGVEEWDMLIGCAASLRNHLFPIDRFIGLIRSDELELENVLRFLGQHSGLEKSEARPTPDNKRKRKSSAAAEVRVKIETPKRKKRMVGALSSFPWGDSGEEEDELVEEGGDSDSDQDEEEGSDTEDEEEKSINEDDASMVSDENGNPDEPATSTRDDETVPNQATSQKRLVGKGHTKNLAFGTPEPVDQRAQSPKKQQKQATKPTRVYKSPFFSTPTSPKKDPDPEITPPPSTTKKPRPPRGTVSSLPVPPLSAPRFGLIQEELADNPFRLLVAITFLIRTAGKSAIPVFRQLIHRFPTPSAIAAADPAEITALIRPLGLSVVRCAKIQKYARLWLENPPRRNRRYVVKNYPGPGDGGYASAGQLFGPESDVCDGEVDAVTASRRTALGCAWEIGHLTQGRYALDSWRIFCRDVLLGRAEDWKGKGRDGGFQPEWMRVLPEDKELRACLRWMWMREGWEWDPLTGEREPLREEMREAVDSGRVGYDDCGNLVILE